MGYLGTPPAIGFSSTKKDSFSGDNSTTGFTMSKIAATGTDIQVFVDNIRQEPTTAYSVSGTTLTFTEAPPTGTNNVYVIHQHQALGTGPLPPQDLGSTDYIFGDDISFNSDGAVINFGLDSDIKLVHVHNTGLSLQTDSSQLLFGADNDINLTHVADTGLTTNGNFSLKSDSSVLKFGADEEVTLTHNHNTGLILGGTTPSLTIGDAGAEDTKIVFDGNAKDFYIGLDDSADKLVIGEGSTVGTNNILTITDDTVTIGDAAAVDSKLVFDGNAQDYYIALDDSADDLLIGLGSTVGTTAAIAIDENLKITTGGDIVMGGTTPTLTIGDAGAEDTAIVFDGNAQDFYIALDDSADDLIIGKGSTVGTTPVISIDENLKTQFGGGAVGKTQTANATGSTTLDYDAHSNFVLTATGNVTLANPSTETVGQTGIIVFIQDGTGSRTIATGTDYEWPAGTEPAISTSANSVDILPYFVDAANSILLGNPQLAFATD